MTASALTISPEPPRLQELFGARGWLSEQPAAFQRALLSMGRTLHFGRGSWVFNVGDPAGGIYGVLSGGIGVEGGGPFHAVRLGHVLRAGAWFGYHPALSGGGRRQMGMRAMEDSTLLHVPLAPLQALMRGDAEAARAIGRMADDGDRLGTRVISDLLIPDAARRVAAVLLRVTGTDEGVEPNDPAGFLLTQAELGELANVSRPRVNRILADFVRCGWVLNRYQRLRVLDPIALRAFAATEC